MDCIFYIFFGFFIFWDDKETLSSIGSILVELLYFIGLFIYKFKCLNIGSFSNNPELWEAPETLLLKMKQIRDSSLDSHRA